MYTNVCSLYTPFVRINLELVCPALPIWAAASSVYQPDTWELHSWHDSPSGAAGATTGNPFFVKLVHKVLLCFHLLIVINFYLKCFVH